MAVRGRHFALLLGFVLAVFIGFTAIGRERPPATAGSPAPRPVTSAPPTATASPVQPSLAPGDVSVQMTKTAVPAEFRYLVLGGGNDFRVMLLDLDAGKTSELAVVHVARAASAPALTYALISSSADGRAVLLLVVVPEATSSVFLLRPETGDARALVRGAVARAEISPDGARFAVGRNEPDRSLAGLWIGTVADGAARRLVADDPQFAGSPPVPFAFSPDAGLLVFGLGLGETGYRAMLMPVGSAEARVDRSSGDARLEGGGAAALGPGAGAQFRSAQEIFVWSSRSLFGGESVAYSYDLATKRATQLYRPSGDTLLGPAVWRPGAAEYATVERPSCCGLGAGAVWLRGRDGAARRLGEWPFLGEVWWSRDGSRLFATMGGDDATGEVTDLLTGRSVMRFCRRGGTPGACV
jgi:hypothetical protein